jgi:MerR HTH family regulatory protein
MANDNTDEPLFGMTHAVVQTGSSAKTIVSYEAAGLLPNIRRTSNGDRLFTPRDIERIKQIRKAREERHGRTGKRRVDVVSTVMGR